MRQPETYSDAQLAMGQQVRTLYIRERRSREEQLSGRPSTYKPGKRWDGGETRGGSFIPIWPGVARFMLQHRVDPPTYVHCQFTDRHLRMVPEPNMLKGDSALRRYQEAIVGIEERIESEFVAQKQICKQQIGLLFETTPWTRDEILENVLFDETLILGALFRYCFARKSGVKRVWQEYREAAMFEYIRYPEEYDRTWGSWLTDKFKERADQLYRSLAK